MKSHISSIIKTLLITAFILSIYHVSNAASVNPDGSFSHIVPIDVPPGTNGMAPKLALVYNSNAGNGMLGVGWSLEGLGAITRDTTYPINYDENDHYVGPGGRLVLIDSATKTYHYENEAFVRIEAVGGSLSTGPDYWVKTKPDGMKYYYGLDSITELPAGEIGSNYTDYTFNSRITAVDRIYNNSECVRAWALCMVKDLNDNFYVVEYQTDSGEYYPVKITYTDNMTNWIDEYRAVEFEYTKPGDDNARSDCAPMYNYGTRVKTAWKMKSITSKLEDLPERTYTITYDESNFLSLSRIKLINDDKDLGEAVIFTWNGESQGFDNSELVWATNTGWAGSPYVGYADFNGDGKSDLWYVKKVLHRLLLNYQTGMILMQSQSGQLILAGQALRI